MSIPFYSDIDLNNNKIKNFTVDTLDQAPTNPNKGQQYYNTADNKLYYYNGTEWVTGATGDSSDVFMPYNILSLTNDSTAEEINTAFGSTENITLFKNTIKNHKGIVFISTPINYVSTVYSIAVDYVVTSSVEAYIVKTIYNNNYVTYQFTNAKDANTFNSIKVTTTPIETPQVDNFKYTTSAEIVSETPTFSKNDLKNLINDAILDEHYYLYYSGDNIFTTSLNIDTTTTSGSSIITLYVNGCTREHKYINYTVVGTVTGTAKYGTELTSSQYNEFNTSKVITITYNQDLSQKSNYFKFSKSTLANRVDYTGYTSAQILSRIITKEEIRFLVNNFRNLYKYRFIVGSNLYVNVKASAIDTMLNINFSILNNGDQYISYGISSEIDESITLPVTDSVLDKICNNLSVGDKIVFDLSQEITNIDVVDNLNSENTEAALSANQGRVLDNRLQNLENGPDYPITIKLPFYSDSIKGKLSEESTLTALFEEMDKYGGTATYNFVINEEFNSQTNELIPVIWSNLKYKDHETYDISVWYYSQNNFGFRFVEYNLMQSSDYYVITASKPYVQIKDIATKYDVANIKTKIGDTLPIGATLEWFSTTIPDNWLICDGSAVSRTTYSDLFAVIGTTFGAGDGSTTFNLPNTKGRTIVGLDAADTTFNAIGNVGGEKTHTLTVAEMPEHTHKFRASTTLGNDEGTITYGEKTSGSIISGNYGNAIQKEGNSQPHNNLQPYIVSNYIIKAKQSSGVVATVVDNLTSTSSTNALSANQGKTLNEKIDKSTTYSTNEQAIGTWIDGKTIYRKVIDFGALPNATKKEVAHNISNIDKFITVEGIATRQDDTKFTQSLPLVYMSSESNYNTTLGANTTYVEIRCVENRDMFKAYVTLEYTKTTD